MLWLLTTIGNWFYAIPGPTENWATIIGDLAWPGTALFLALRFRTPLRKILETLAERVEHDHVKLGNLLEITPSTTVIPLDPNAAASESDLFDARDVQIIEDILEFVAAQEENGDLLVRWIESNVDPDLDPLDFVSEPEFREQRRLAHHSLIEGGTEHG